MCRQSLYHSQILYAAPDVAALADPVVLCATGQVYDYSAIRPWLSNSNWRCPKSNTVVADPCVARLPGLRRAALQWAHDNGVSTSEDEGFMHPPSSLEFETLDRRCV